MDSTDVDLAYRTIVALIALVSSGAAAAISGAGVVVALRRYLDGAQERRPLALYTGTFLVTGFYALGYAVLLVAPGTNEIITTRYFRIMSPFLFGLIALYTHLLTQEHVGREELIARLTLLERRVEEVRSVGGGDPSKSGAL